MLTCSENYTYSIDLTSSWTNESVILHQILKPEAPVLNAEVLWHDSSGEGFYAYNGAVSGAYPGTPPTPPDNALYHFTPYGNEIGRAHV